MRSGLLNTRIEPDFHSLRKNLLRQGTPQRVHYIELYQDREIKDLVVDLFQLDRDLDPGASDYALRREVAIQKFLGYDVVCGAFEPMLSFPSNSGSSVPVIAEDTTRIAGQSRGARQWANEHDGIIRDEESFENYAWPDPTTMDLSTLDWAEKHLDPRMKLYLPCHSVFELTSWIFGYERFCYFLYDNPDLVDAVVDKIGEIRLAMAEAYCDYECVGFLFGGDDMGFKTGLLASREFLAKKILPWYTRMADLAHKKGKLFLLHNCGNIEALMDDFIDTVHLDGRHSFEDVITPVTEAKHRYGNRIALLGGIDMDLLCRGTESEIRKKVRDTLDVCQPGGGYCLGAGNTVANYIPLENYLAMLDEGRRYSL